MFSCNEKVVYPGHGVAVIEQIIEKKIAGNSTKFFRLRFLHKDMIILVPVNNTKSVGIRPLGSPDSIKAVFELLSSPFNTKIKDPNGTNWNKRNKEYQARLMNGGLHGICEIYRELKSIESLKDLSFGEKVLLSQTEDLLLEEIVLISQEERELVLKKIRDSIGVMVQQTSNIMVQRQI